MRKLLFSLVLLAACNSSEPPVKDDSVKKDSVPPPPPVTNALQQKLMGAWTEGSSENAAFDIQADSIYYVESLVSYKYELNADTLLIDYNDTKFTGQVSFSGDTLLLTELPYMNTTKYRKFKN